jgi:hypothetical protein
MAPTFGDVGDGEKVGAGLPWGESGPDFTTCPCQ